MAPLLLLHARCRLPREARLALFPIARYKTAAAMPRQRPPRQGHRASSMMDPDQIRNVGDIGLLQDTFIMPTGENKPSIFTAPAQRLQLEKARVTQRFIDVRNRWICWYMSKLKFRLGEAAKTAPILHKKMYVAFARGDTDTLREICGEGLFDSLLRRSATSGTVKLEWTLHKYLQKPRMVSNKAQHYVEMGMDVRQAVVRIRSVQSLKKVPIGGELIEGSPREIVEYVVIEKRKVGGEETPWYVWGTTEETTLSSLAEAQKRKLRMGI